MGTNDKRKLTIVIATAGIVSSMVAIIATAQGSSTGGPIGSAFGPGADRAPASAPAIVARAGGGYDVFYRGWDGAVFQRTVVGGVWSSSTSLGGRIVNAPAAAAIGSDAVLVVHGRDGRVDIRLRTSGRWSPWRDLGIVATAAPSVSARRDGRVDVFVRGQDDRIHTRTLQRTTPRTPWRTLSGDSVASGPAAVSSAAGRIDLLAVGFGHRVLYRSLAGGAWSAWHAIGGRTYGGVAVTRTSDGRLVALIRDPAGRLRADVRIGAAWSGWTDRGGPVIDTPAAASNGEGDSIVVAAGPSGAYRTWHCLHGSWTRPAGSWTVTATPPPPGRLLGTDWTSIPTTRKVVALTFDGGADAAGLASIRATLQHKNVPATFFLTGEWVRDFPAKANQISLSGFLCGNHSNTHQDFTTLGDDRIATEVRLAQAEIRTTTGADSRPLFRFPKGAVDSRVLREVNDLGYVAVRWTVDTLGWKGTSGGITVRTVIDRVLAGARPGEIVMMHVGANPKDHTTLDASALPTVIDRLRARGYSFVTLRSLVG